MYSRTKYFTKKAFHYPSHGLTEGKRQIMFYAKLINEFVATTRGSDASTKSAKIGILLANAKKGYYSFVSR